MHPLRRALWGNTWKEGKEQSSQRPYYSFWRKVGAVKLDVIAFLKSRRTKLFKSDNCGDAQRFNLLQRSIAQLKNFQRRVGLVVICILFGITSSKSKFVNARNASINSLSYWWTMITSYKCKLQDQSCCYSCSLWWWYRSGAFLHWQTLTFETPINMPQKSSPIFQLRGLLVFFL